MTASHTGRPMTQRELDQDEYRIDHSRPRRTCPQHPRQQVMTLFRGMPDLCPYPHDGSEAQS